MNESTAIIPISRNEQNSFIDGLLREKQLARQMALEGQGNLQLDGLLLTWYKKSLDFILRLNLLIQEFGTLDSSKNRYIWARDFGIHRMEAIYYLAGHITEVIVDGKLQVCHNGQPGARILLPGEWMYTVVAALEEMEWSAEMQARAEQEKLILTLDAKV